MAGSAAAERTRTIEENMGLLHACAHRLKGRGIEYEDLFQAGCIGLVKATDAFDYGRGVRFSTYAVPVILGEMRRLFRDGGTVKVSRTLKELSLRVGRQREQFAASHDRDPTVGELAALLQVEPEQITEAIGAASPPLSLTGDSEEGGGQLDLPIPSPEERLAEIISLGTALERLEARDRALLRLRYYGSRTQAQTAAVLGMTQVQVSRREKKLLAMLRAELEG